MVKLKCPSIPAGALAFISSLSAFCVAGTAFIEHPNEHHDTCQKENLQNTRKKQNKKTMSYAQEWS